MPDPSRPSLATFAMAATVAVVEMAADAGFDAVVVDLEHGTSSVADLAPLAAAARGRGARLLVRLPRADSESVSLVLDTGVDGIVVAHVDSAAQAADLADASLLPPRGGRSINPFVRALGYGGAAAYTPEPSVFAMIESAGGLADVEPIAAVPGITGLFVGPFDLSAALGVPGQPEHPDVVATIERIQRLCAENDKRLGLYAHTAEAARRWFEAGADLITYGADVGFLATALADAASSVLPLPLRHQETRP